MFRIEVQYGVCLWVIGLWFTVKSFKVNSAELGEKVCALLPAPSFFKKVDIQKIRATS